MIPGASSNALSRKNDTAHAASFSSPSGVTAPGDSFSMSASSSADAKLSGRKAHQAGLETGFPKGAV